MDLFSGLAALGIAALVLLAPLAASPKGPDAPTPCCARCEPGCCDDCPGDCEPGCCEACPADCCAKPAAK